MSEARFHASMAAFDTDAWNHLAGSANPFVRHAFLEGLERHGCIGPDWGWQPHHLGLYEAGQLVAAAPLYFKGNSRGEFVFDWGWAQAWEQAGGRYYPKLLNGAPWSPVTGPRLLVGAGAHADRLRRELADAMQAECTQLGLSSLHANFLPEADAAAFGPAWLARFDVQFHWHNRGYRDFDDFLAQLRHKKRKNIRRERRQAAQAGLECTIQAGSELSHADWDAVHELYEITFARKANYGVLTAGFLRDMAAQPDIGLKVALARRGKTIVAMALLLQGGDSLYGRYWGCREEHAGLHFELCYYLGIDYCIRHGLRHFEPGAQGEHKMARGFLPTRTHSRHYLPNASFRTAVARALRHEADMLTAYETELAAHSPYAQQATKTANARSSS